MTQVIGTRAPGAPRKKDRKPKSAQVWRVYNSRTDETLGEAGSKYAAKQRAKLEREKWADANTAPNARRDAWDKACAVAPIAYKRVKG